MKIPIVVGVIGVVAALVITSIIGFSEMGTKPPNEIYVVEREEPNGQIICPNGFKIVPADFVFSLKFSEEESEAEGVFSVTSLTTNSPEIIATLPNGSFDSGNYLFKGEGFYNSELAILCSIDTVIPEKITVWGKCGNEVLIRFETDNGILGIATGTADCV